MNILFRTDQKTIAVGRRVVVIADDFFSELLTVSAPDEWKTIRCQKGLPEGAVLVGVDHDAERREFRFLFEHESFERGNPGDVWPILSVCYQQRSEGGR